ncbi:ArsR/SmtB family transcription factor [Caminicella sporogenes]|uniref:ArsR/SmtB family transcription factor n=1 Tax=Caminicella sporogenes TaxID=166485 RepID=UPI002540E483|nr:metalloregulator ArsR/SmtB family transcription factor [Caminicella sporogenes]WIF93935.1 metalloregulator ArsR/SmtB family transcription factor [Caminicella sporogenes]
MNLLNMEVDILKALAHPTRLQIVKKLAKGTLCVCELNQDIELSQSNLSQHLKILRDANILVQERDGTRINYSIKDKEILEIVKIVEKLVEEEIKKIASQIGGMKDA